MLLTKKHLLVHHAASKDDTRPVLTQVYVRRIGNEIVAAATDGYILAEVREPIEPLEDFPVIDGVPHESISQGYIPADNAKKMISHVKKNKILPILNHILMQKGEIIYTDLERTTRFAAHEVEGDYPEYEKLVPAEKKEAVKVNPEMLRRAMSVFAGDDAVYIEVGEKSTDPVVFRSDNPDTKVTVVVMPLRG